MHENTSPVQISVEWKRNGRTFTVRDLVRESNARLCANEIEREDAVLTSRSPTTAEVRGIIHDHRMANGREHAVPCTRQH